MQLGAVAPTVGGLSPISSSALLPNTVQTVNSMNTVTLNVGMGIGAYQGLSSMGMTSSHTAYHSSLVLGDYHSL